MLHSIPVCLIINPAGCLIKGIPFIQFYQVRCIQPMPRKKFVVLGKHPSTKRHQKPLSSWLISPGKIHRPMGPFASIKWVRVDFLSNYLDIHWYHVIDNNDGCGADGCGHVSVQHEIWGCWYNTIFVETNGPIISSSVDLPYWSLKIIHKSTVVSFPYVPYVPYKSCIKPPCSIHFPSIFPFRMAITWVSPTPDTPLQPEPSKACGNHRPSGGSVGGAPAMVGL